MKNAILLVLAILASSAFAGCSSLSPELLEALAKDNASLCISHDIRGGVGSIVAPSGGYGQSTFVLCRSNHDGAVLAVSPDGSMSITHN